MQPDLALHNPPLTPRFRIAMSLLIVGLSAILIFARLGHYPLWDDEANTALIGMGVWHTGDTLAAIDGNIVAYHDGAELVGDKARYMPPAQYYLVAPFIGLFGRDTFWVRFPFAASGLLSIILLVRWLWRDAQHRETWYSAAAALLTCSGLFLQFRQCRYYAPTLFFTLLVAYLYCHADRRWRTTILLTLASAALCAFNYLNYAVVMFCLAADWFLFTRKSKPFTRSQIIFFLTTQVIIAAALCSIWFPIGKPLSGEDDPDPIKSRWLRIWAHFLMVPFAELMLLPTVALGLLMSWRDRALRRILIAAVLFVLICSVLTPGKSINGRPRYLIPVFWAGIAVSTLVIAHTARWNRPAAMLLATFTFLCPFFPTRFLYYSDNASSLTVLRRELLQRRFSFAEHVGSNLQIQFTPIAYLVELIQPQETCYDYVHDWLRATLPPGATIAMSPNFHLYPLMFSAPEYRYAWQFTQASRAKYPDLPDWNFAFQSPPQYWLVFQQPKLTPAERAFLAANYHELPWLPVLSRNTFRQELSEHSFVTRVPTVPSQHIHVYCRNPMDGSK